MIYVGSLLRSTVTRLRVLIEAFEFTKRSQQRQILAVVGLSLVALSHCAHTGIPKEY